MHLPSEHSFRISLYFQQYSIAASIVMNNSNSDFDSTGRLSAMDEMMMTIPHLSQAKTKVRLSEICNWINPARKHSPFVWRWPHMAMTADGSGWDVNCKRNSALQGWHLWKPKLLLADKQKAMWRQGEMRLAPPSRHPQHALQRNASCKLPCAGSLLTLLFAAL